MRYYLRLLATELVSLKCVRCALALGLLLAVLGCEEGREKSTESILAVPASTKASESIVFDIYDIGDLVTPRFDDSEPAIDTKEARVAVKNVEWLSAGDFAEGLRKLDPDLWAQPGVSVEERANKLIVTQTAAGHAQVRGYLGGLRIAATRSALTHCKNFIHTILSRPLLPQIELKAYALSLNESPAKPGETIGGRICGYAVRATRQLAPSDWENLRSRLSREDWYDGYAHRTFHPTDAIEMSFGRTPMSMIILISTKEERVHFAVRHSDLKSDFCYERGLTEEGAKELATFLAGLW